MAQDFLEGKIITSFTVGSRGFYDWDGKRNKHGTPLAGIKILGKTGGDEVLNWIKKNLKKREKVK
ncbi:MAG: hypothetical protein ACXWM6_16860 [Thermodesulfobacteriota bacterium]